MPPDLTALRGSADAAPARRHTWLLPVAVVALIAIPLGSVAWRTWAPATPVTVVPAILAASSDAPSAGLVLQAAGWIEPDPHPIGVSTWIDGTVTAVLVRDGDTVTAGQELARLDDRDAILDEQAADAALAHAEAGWTAAKAASASASARLASERARLSELEDQAQRLAAAGPGIQDGERRQAQLRVATQVSVVAAAETAVEETRAAIAAADAQRRAAAIARERATLAHERCRVRAPVAGVVMSVATAPGRRLLLSDDPRHALVAELFQPGELQVRVDVPLADAGRLRLGQSCEVVTELLPQRTFTGTLTRLAGSADVARNTVQAKVRLQQPDAALRPEMLARVRFLGDASAPATTTSTGVWAPAAGIRERQGERAMAYVVTLDQRLERRDLMLGAEREGWIAVREGLRAGEPVVTGGELLRPGLRVRVSP